MTHPLSRWHRRAAELKAVGPTAQNAQNVQKSSTDRVLNVLNVLCDQSYGFAGSAAATT